MHDLAVLDDQEGRDGRDAWPEQLEPEVGEPAPGLHRRRGREGADGHPAVQDTIARLAQAEGGEPPQVLRGAEPVGAERP